MINPVNNPPAFPTGIITDGKGKIIGGSNGMTLRDYFAAKAMAAIILREGKDHFVVEEITITAYQYADAMLETREQ